LPILAEWALSTGAFRRNRVPPEKKVLAAALCSSGYSYRDVARMLGGLSYIAVRDAYFSLLTSLPEATKKDRRLVALDGEDVREGSSEFHLWLARDADSGEIMGFGASPRASAEDGARFLSGVAAQCANRPLVRLGTGGSFPRGLLNLDLYFQESPTGSIIGRLGRLLLRGGG
jgi:putative transposase